MQETVLVFDSYTGGQRTGPGRQWARERLLLSWNIMINLIFVYVLDGYYKIIQLKVEE